MNIGVFGLGYVGIVNMACFSKLGHTVYGCDIKSQKVDSVKEGKSPIFEPQVEELIQIGVQNGTVRATSQAGEVIENTELSLICVGTPSRQDGTVNLDYTVNTTIDIADHVLRLNKPYTVVFRSTIPPGTIEEQIIPVFKERLGEKFHLVKVAFLPEFLREGVAVKDFFHCSRIVIGTDGSELTNLKELLSYSAQIPLVFTDYKTAEFVKYVDNAFHAMKIAFVNEAYAVGSAYGVDITTANQIFLMDKHLNVAETYLRPGLPFGGSCLPKDMRAINHLAKQKSLSLPVLDNILVSNQQLLQRLLDKLIATGKKKIAMYGLTFKSGTDDVRESPMLWLSRELIKQGYDLSIYDTDINVITLRIEQAEVVRFIESDPTKALYGAEVIAVCKKGFAQHASGIPSSTYVFNFFNQEVFEGSFQQETLY